jgi:hypothetical protein
VQEAKLCQGLKIDAHCTCVGSTPQRDYQAEPRFHLEPSVFSFSLPAAG